MMTFIIPSASAPSVPGRMGMYQSALCAVRCRSGSMTTTLAPLSWACLMNGHMCRLVERTLQAHRMM